MDLVVVNFMEDNQAGVSRLISEFLHRPVTDLNQEIVNLSGQTMDELTMSRGEKTSVKSNMTFSVPSWRNEMSF